MDPLGRRSFSRSVFRSFVDELRRTGIFDQVRAQSSATLAPLLDDPRRGPGWIDAAPFDEIGAAVCALRGRDSVRALGYHLMKSGGVVAMLEPIIHLSLAVLGGDPASLLSKAHLMASVFSRGSELSWVPSTPAAGSMRIRCDEALPELSWAPWEGTFMYGFDLTGTRGEIAQARPAADQRSCEIEVRWTRKTK